MKAYDMVDWIFIGMVFWKIGLHPTFDKQVEDCISTPSFSFSINGELQGFLKNTRGHRQGDLISPYIFVITINIFSLKLEEITSKIEFEYHWKCKKSKITHLCFANDLFIFCNAEVNSVKLVKEALDRFQRWSRLITNNAKSNVFFSRASIEEKRAINILQFEEGTIPFKYLGVPIVSTKFSLKDCKP